MEPRDERTNEGRQEAQPRRFRIERLEERIAPRGNGWYKNHGYPGYDPTPEPCTLDLLGGGCY